MSQELYELPEGWGWIKLGEVLDVRDGTHDSPKYLATGYPLVTSKNLTRTGLDLKNVKYISENDFLQISKRSKVDQGDILFAMIGTIGNPIIVEKEPSIAIKNVALFKARESSQCMEFFRYFLISPDAIDRMLSASKGAAQKFVGLGVLRGFNLPLPPINEQKRIVAKLDTLFTRIDTAITHLKQTLELSKALFASVLDGAVRPKEIPDNWIEGKFGEFASFSQGLQVPVGDQIHEFSEGLVQFLRISDFVRDDEPARYIQDPGDRYKIREQDLSMIRYGDAGKVVRGLSGAIANNLFRINTTDIFNVDFLYYLLSSPSVYGFLRAGNTSSTMPAISFKVVKNIPVAIPPKDEQKKIVSHLDALTERAQALEVTTQEKLNDLTALKASLLDAAFKGQL